MYLYDNHRAQIFTDKGQRTFLKVRDKARELLELAGAFRMLYPCSEISGDVWDTMAYVDRLVELGEIREITESGVAGQDRVFVKARYDTSGVGGCGYVKYLVLTRSAISFGFWLC